MLVIATEFGLICLILTDLVWECFNNVFLIHFKENICELYTWVKVSPLSEFGTFLC